MCRYAYQNYRDHFACFECRKAFQFWQWPACDESTFQSKQRLLHMPREIVCADCSRPMTDMGLDFRAPPKADHAGWAVLKSLAANGFDFQELQAGVAPPRTAHEVKAWLDTRTDKCACDRPLEQLGTFPVV
ncbi:MAG: hypothetical protein QM811_23375 [Pirellulales bacterium]